MDKQTVSFRMESDRLQALDSLAEALDRDRSHLLNEAVRVYLDVQEWQAQQIKAGIQQADRGKLTGHDEVKKMVARWRRR